MKRKFIKYLVILLSIFLVGITIYKSQENAKADVIYSIGKEANENDLVTGWYLVYFKLSDTDSFNYLSYTISFKNANITERSYYDGFIELANETTPQNGDTLGTEVVTIASNKKVTSADAKEVKFYNTSNELVTEKIVVVEKIYVEKVDEAQECLVTVTGVDIQNITTNDISITKVAQSSSGTYVDNALQIGLNEQFNYVINVKNNSIIPTDEIILKDILPSEISEFDIVDNASALIENNIITLSLGTIDVGETKSITIKAVTNSYTNNIITNTSCAYVNGYENGQVCSSADVILKKPNLTINKVASKEQVSPYDTFSYTITLANTGNALATGVVLKDTVPSTFEVLSIDGDYNIPVSNEINYDIGTINAGETKSIIVNCKVKSDAELITYNNKAIVSSNENDDISSDVDVLVVNYIIKYGKLVNKIEAIPNESILYTIDVENIGNITGQNLVIKDTLPDYLEVTDETEVENNVVTFTIDSLAPNETKIFTINTKVKSDVEDLTVINNCIKLYDYTNNLVGNDVCVQTTVKKPIISLEKTVNEDNLFVDGTLLYTLKLSNTGSAKAQNVLVIDIIPSNLEIISLPEGFSQNGNTVTYSASINSGETLTFEIKTKVKDDVENDEKIVNCAYFTYNGQNGENQCTNTIFKKPILEITKTSNVSRSLTLNDTVTYTITIKNTGGIEKENFVLKDIIDENLELITYNGNYISSSRELYWDIDVLDAGESKVFTYEAKVIGTNKETINNEVCIYNNNVKDLCASTNINIYETPVETSKLTVTKIASKSEVLLNEEFYYTIIIQNTGNVNLTDISIEDILPSGVEYINTELPSKITQKNNTNYILSSLNINESISFSIFVKATTIGTKTNNIKVTYIAGIETATEEVNVVKPEINITKTSSKAKVQNNEQFYYYITIQNKSNYDVSNLVVTDEFDESIHILEHDGVKNNNTITYNISKLDANSSLTLKVKVYITGKKAKDIIKNIAVLKENGEVIQESQVDIKIVQPKITIVKTVNKNEVKINDEFIYTFEISSDSSITLENILFEDTISDALEIVNAGDVNYDNNKVSFYFSLMPGETKKMEITVKVKEETTEKEISNIATIKNGDEIISSNETKVKIVTKDNPNTGIFINILKIICLLFVGIIIIKFISNKRKIYKI
ncbi:MAG: hypothetical protein ACI4XR_05100 [Bacilli bacterium]